MPETLSFKVGIDHLAELADIRPGLPEPAQVLGPAPTPSGNGWSAYILVTGSIRGITLASEPEAGGRRLDIKREGCASAADFELMKTLSDLAIRDTSVSLSIDGQPATLADLDVFFSAERKRTARANEWGMVLDRYFRRGRGRAVFSSPLADLTVHLEDVDFPNFSDHLTELEDRLARRLLPILHARVAATEHSGEARLKFSYARWSVQSPTLVPEVDQALILRGDQPIGFVSLRDICSILGNRVVVARDRPPRRILLPPLQLDRDAGLLAQLERRARGRPPIM